MSDTVTVLLLNFGGLGAHVAIQVPREHEDQADYLTYAPAAGPSYEAEPWAYPGAP